MWVILSVSHVSVNIIISGLWVKLSININNLFIFLLKLRIFNIIYRRVSL